MRYLKLRGQNRIRPFIVKSLAQVEMSKLHPQILIIKIFIYTLIIIYLIFIFLKIMIIYAFINFILLKYNK